MFPLFFLSPGSRMKPLLWRAATGKKRKRLVRLLSPPMVPAIDQRPCRHDTPRLSSTEITICSDQFSTFLINPFFHYPTIGPYLFRLQLWRIPNRVPCLSAFVARRRASCSPPPCPPFFGTGRCSRCFSSFLSPHAHSRHSAPPFSSSWIHEKLAPSFPPLSSDASSPSLHLLPSPPLHLIN